MKLKVLSTLCCNSYDNPKRNWPQLCHFWLKIHNKVLNFSLWPPPHQTLILLLLTTPDRQNRWSGIDLKSKQWPHDRKSRLSILPLADLIRKKQCPASMWAEHLYLMRRLWNDNKRQLKWQIIEIVIVMKCIALHYITEYIFLFIFNNVECYKKVKITCTNPKGFYDLTWHKLLRNLLKYH